MIIYLPLDSNQIQEFSNIEELKLAALKMQNVKRTSITSLGAQSAFGGKKTLFGNVRR